MDSSSSTISYEKSGPMNSSLNEKNSTTNRGGINNPQQQQQEQPYPENNIKPTPYNDQFDDDDLEKAKNYNNNINDGDHDDNHQDGSALKPQTTHQSFIAQQFSIFSHHVRHLHYQVFMKTGINLLVMSTLIIGVLSVYWGSLWKRSERIHNLNI